MTKLWLWRDGARFIGYQSEFPNIEGGDPAVLGDPVACVELTSPPAKHDPRDNGPGREDADAHPPLGQVEAGPQRHSDDPWMAQAVALADREGNACWCANNFDGPHPGRCKKYCGDFVDAIAAALKSVSLAAREECARIADMIDAQIDPTREHIEHEIVTAKIIRAICQTIPR